MSCTTCAPTYCAPARCYCEHEACPAFATYVDPWAQPFNDPAPKRPAKGKPSSWDNREGETWIDAL